MKFQFVFFIMFIFSKLSMADPLLGLPVLTIPQNNPQTITKIKLGQLLFNDIRFSIDNTISCASCHQIEKAFTDGLATPLGVHQQTGYRNAPTVVNAAFYQTFFIDGRSKSLEEQALGPFLNPVEHGLDDYQKIIDIVSSDADYTQRFKQVFGLLPKNIKITHVAQAIASFERTLIAGNSAFDRYYFGRDRSQISDSAARGLRLFRRKGNCSNCHEISWDSALFMDNLFYNIGVGFQRLKPVEQALKNTVSSVVLSDAQKAELGLYNISKNPADIGKFKTPTLRNISLTSPYMHDGSMNTLEEVVEYYDQGGEPNLFLDPAIFPLNFTAQEKTDLVEFLKALTSQKN